MRILVIGASGLVGGNCFDHFLQSGYEVVGTHLTHPTERTVYFNAIEINHEKNEPVKSFNPDIIIHCGALTNVDYCESHPEESYNQTVRSAINIAGMARHSNATLVYVSTDYVFDGLSGPYSENDATAPINFYGKHKLEAEKIVQATSDNHLIIRVTNVYGNETRNKNFVGRIIKNIIDNKEINLMLPFDQFATPVNASDIAKGIELLVQTTSRGLYHFGSTDYYSRVQLFYRIINYFPSFSNYILKTVSSAELKQSAKRPLMGGLTSSKFLSEHPGFLFSNVDDYLKTFIQN